MSRAKLLLGIQAVDLRRDEVQALLQRIQAALQDDRSVIKARDAVARAESELAEVDRLLRQRSAERDAAKSRLSQEEHHLYGGKVRVAKEVQNLEREVASLRRQLEPIEDLVLQSMLDRDEAVAGLGRSRQGLAQAEAGASDQHEALVRRQAALEAESTRLAAEKEGFMSTVPAADRDLYERLRKTKAGRAVAELNDRSCSACGIQLPNQDVARIRTGAQHVICPGCGRIVLG
jgi:uncharacterized protein